MTLKYNPDSNLVAELFDAIELLFENEPKGKQEHKAWTVEINHLISRVNTLTGKTIYRPQ
jgi:hypothetical protein